jgi:hypothetical protein
MELTDIFQSLGEENFRALVGTISISRLKTFKLYESLKARSHLPKLNVQGLKKVAPRFWERIREGDQDLASDLAQAILTGHFELIVDVLDFLGIPHHEGFFDKETDAAALLTEGWQSRAFDQFREKYPEPLLVLYLNHLSLEITKDKPLFVPAGTP